MKTILVPIDFSSISEAVVREAALLAKVHKGWIMLLTVVQPPVITNEYGTFPVDVGEIMAISVKTAARQLSQWKQKLKRRGLACDARQVSGPAVSLILEEAETLRADYIVIGSHGHNAVYDLLVGSTTHGVLKKSPCPVLIVPATKPRGPKAKGKKSKTRS